MEFINRQQEIRELLGYFEYSPSNMVIVYGPKSTGKTTLLNHVTNEICTDKKYAVNFINLRGVLIYDFASFLSVFFQKTARDKVRGILGGITLNAGFFQVGIDDEAMLKKNPFKVMEDQLRKAQKKGIQSIIILDEIQALKDIYMNGERMLLDELFNFFVRLTKETHLAHVVLASSDSFFINELYDNAKLAKTTDFLLVNQLEKADITKWLEKEQFTTSEIQFIWEHSKGNPWETEQFILGKKKGITVEATFERIIQYTIGKIDYYLTYSLNAPEKVQMFHFLAKKMIKKGRCPSKVINNLLAQKIVKDMVDKDVWFYDAMNRRVVPNSESIRYAMKTMF